MRKAMKKYPCGNGDLTIIKEKFEKSFKN